jgi:hypothetical protein
MPRLLDQSVRGLNIVRNRRPLWKAVGCKITVSVLNPRSGPGRVTTHTTARRLLSYMGFCAPVGINSERKVRQDSGVLRSVGFNLLVQSGRANGENTQCFPETRWRPLGIITLSPLSGYFSSHRQRILICRYSPVWSRAEGIIWSQGKNDKKMCKSTPRLWLQRLNIVQYKS